MANLRTIGFFREFGGDLEEATQLPKLSENIGDQPQRDEDRIIAYLRNGVGYAGRGEYVKDVLDPASRYALLADLLTDGVYLWRADLAYYVAKYHVRLPSDFIDHARSNNWLIPNRENIEMDDFDSDY